MEVTNTDNQGLMLKNKIEKFFIASISNKKKKGFCITRDVMSILLDKWSIFVMFNLGYFGTMRFGVLKTNIKGISSRMLSVTLKKLESHKIVERKVFAEVPPKVEYCLTPFGQEMADKTVDMNEWLLEKFKNNQLKSI